MELIDFNAYQQNAKMYGGTAGRKIGITYQGEDYILKFPGNLKEQNMKNILLSYSNSPVCEYIGSQIYEMLGMPVHETLLGTRNGKVVVACKDFLKQGERLYEFDKIKVTYEPAFLDSNGNETNGVGLDLYEVLMTIKKHPFLADIPGVEQRFWDMFVVDALIGNTDRNNTNWGIIVAESGEKKLAPVYDNGNCLNNKWDDMKIQSVLSDEKALEAEIYKGRRCVYELNGKRVNPYHLIQKMEYEACNDAVERMAPKISGKLEDMNRMLMDNPVLTEAQKQLFGVFLRERYKQVLKPVYDQIVKYKLEQPQCKKKGRCI